MIPEVGVNLANLSGRVGAGRAIGSTADPDNRSCPVNYRNVEPSDGRDTITPNRARII